MSSWLNTTIPPLAVGPQTLLLVVLVTFCLGQITGWMYMWTHTGLSYSQSFAASLVVMPVLVAIIMALLSSSVAAAFGLLAVVAVVRFRNAVKDVRDTIFILWAITQGMGVGTLQFSSTLVGAVAINAIFLYLWLTSFGSRHRYNAVLSLQLSGDNGGLTDALQVLRRHSARLQLASQRTLSANKLALLYHLSLRDVSRCGELRSELEAMHGVTDVLVNTREDETEM